MTEAKRMVEEVMGLVRSYGIRIRTYPPTEPLSEFLDLPNEGEYSRVKSAVTALCESSAKAERYGKDLEITIRDLSNTRDRLEAENWDLTRRLNETTERHTIIE